MAKSCALRVLFVLLVMTSSAEHASLSPIPASESSYSQTTISPLTAKADPIPAAVALALKQFLYSEVMAQSMAHGLDKNLKTVDEMAENLQEVLNYDMVSPEEALRVLKKMNLSNRLGQTGTMVSSTSSQEQDF